MDKYYLAVDIGASSGRHMLASMKDGKMQLEEVYRFPNGMTEKNGTLCWDVERLFTEIKNGLKVCKELGKIPVSMAIDTCADQPYSESDFVVTVDGFLVSDNVTVEDALVLDTGFIWSDHNPVYMDFILE